MEIPKRWNWLKPNEVFALLKFYTSCQVPMLNHYTALPQSGDLFYVKKSEFRRWRQDGHGYVTRKNSSGIREDREKYSFESEIIQCTYVHGSGACSRCKKTYLIVCPECSLPITSVLFHRRAYWLLSNPEIILVHYLDDSQKSMHIDNETSSISGQSTAEEQIKRLEEVLKQIDCEEITPVQIIDFSPEWSDIHGGCKVLICIDPPLIVPNPQCLMCAFGDILVHIESVQLGVFKCFTPAHAPGIVDFYLIYEHKEITQNRKEFEFKEITMFQQVSTKIDWWDKEKREIEDELMEDLSNDLQENFIDGVFDEGFYMTQFQKVIAKKESWENLNRKGRGYLHYLCALGFSSVIRGIKERIKNPNIKDFNCKSPIDISLLKHHYDCAYELIKLSGDATKLFNYQTEETLNDRIQKIQSHVRAWLQQKQFRNLKHAAKTLQKTFRGMVARKNFKYQKQAAIIIQKSVRKWLLSTYQHK